MSNLDLTISDIFYGDTEVLKIMKGNTQKWPNVSQLPYDTEVEYLQTDGTAYIDTGIKTKSTITVDTHVTILDVVGTCAIFGGRIALYNQSNTLYVYRAGQGSNNGWGWRYGNQEKSSTTASAANAPLGNFHITNRESARVININNTSITCDAATFSNDYNIYLFTMNNGGAVSSSILSVTRIKDFKMYDSGTLVRDFIPVKKNNVGYMYDRVSGQLFGNAAGSGAFLYGNDKITSYDAEVEYLQGDESAYIDTGINMRKKTTSVLKVLVPSLPSAIKIFYGAFMDNLSVPKFQIGVKTTANWHLGQPSGGTANGASNSGSFTLNQIYDITLTCPVQASDSTIYLFARNNDIDDKLPCNVKIYSLIIISDGVIVRDFIPVRVGQVGYMYDKVTKQLFGNANSTGAFTFGNDV